MYDDDILLTTPALNFEPKIVLHIYKTLNFVYLLHTIFHFYLINIQINIYFSSKKSPFVTQRSVSQENEFKKSKIPSPFEKKKKNNNNNKTNQNQKTCKLKQKFFALI